MKFEDIEGDLAEVLFTEEQIHAKLAELCRRIEVDYAGEKLLLVGVLRGAVMVMADLARELSLPIEMDWMAVSSYGSGTQSSGVVRILKDLETDLMGKHVLIAEDIIDSGLTLSWLKANLLSRGPASGEIGTHLRSAGTEVTIAANGRRAVELARAQQIDLILMDMQMPELDGYGAAKELRAAGVTTPIVALTANAMAEDRAKCIAAGCTEYLAKPISHADVDEARDLFAAHGEPFNETGWRYIVDKHAGLLPLRIRAVPEGTVPLADARRAQGAQFSLRRFHDQLWLNGNVPLSLLRWELLDERRDVDRLATLR